MGQDMDTEQAFWEPSGPLPKVITSEELWEKTVSLSMMYNKFTSRREAEDRVILMHADYRGSRPGSMLGSVDLEKTCPLDNGKFRHADEPSPANALHEAEDGPRPTRLDKLPSEILCRIMEFTDIPSLTRLRSTTRRFRRELDSLPKYALIYRECPNVLRAIITVEADSFSLNNLSHTLSTKPCDSCKRRFGDYLYLITGVRVCHLCWAKKKKVQPVKEQAVEQPIDQPNNQPNIQPSQRPLQKRQQTAKSKLDSPSILSIPGRYGSCDLLEITITGRQRLYDRSEAGIGVETKDVPPETCLVLAPQLHGVDGKADWGYFCDGEQCRQMTPDSLMLTRPRYTRSDLVAHLKRKGLPLMMTAEHYGDLSNLKKQKHILEAIGPDE